MRQVITLLLIILISTGYSQTCLNVMVNTTNISCANESDGSVELIANNGTAPFAYSIDGGTTFFTDNLFPNLAAGTYDAYVVDAVNCTFAGTVSLTEPSPIETTVNNISNTTDNLCNGGVTISTTGGSQPYYYAWAGGSGGAFSSGITIGDFCAGNYTITITDSQGCTGEVAVSLSDSSTCFVATAQVSYQNCLGTASISVQGGTPPFSYLWSSGETTASISELGQGSYGWTVQDATGCTFSDMVLVESGIDFSIAVNDASCDGADGSATVTVNSGAANPVYSWSDGQTTATATGLVQGWYSVTIEDQGANCLTHNNVYIDEDLSCKVIIEGKVLLDDLNQDCVEDPTSHALVNRMLTLSSQGHLVATTFTDSLGNYDFVVDNGAYDLELIARPIDGMLCPSSNVVAVNAATNGNSYTQDFYKSFQNVDDLSVFAFSGTARPGFTYPTNIVYCNDGSDPASGKITFTHDPLLTNFNAYGTEDVYDAATSTAIWSFSNLLPGECDTITFVTTLPAGTPLGTLLSHNVDIKPSFTDITPDNNFFFYHQTVVGSHDPNDKQNLNSDNPFGGAISPSDTVFTYLIRFQNTGTDTAFTVVIRDQLDESFDLTTIRPVAGSHPYSMDMENNNHLVFFFEDIMLPDSNVNEPASHGFILFSISLKPDLPIGTTISNTAGIYFDFNAPIITNTVENTIQVVASNDLPAVAMDVSVMPNPAGSMAQLTIGLEERSKVVVQIIDLQGRVLKQLLQDEPLAKGENRLAFDTEDLASGVYLLKVETEKGVKTVKLIKN